MSANTNSTRILQISGPMLFEYEFNEKYNDTRSDKYGKRYVGEFEPIIMKLKTGSVLYTETTAPPGFKTNNNIKNVSIPHDKNGSQWFRFKNGDCEPTDYVNKNIKFGILDDTGDIYAAKIFVTEGVMDESTVEERYDELLGILDDAMIAAGCQGAELCDTDIFKIFRFSERLKGLLYAVIAVRGEDAYIFQYYDDYATEGTNPDSDIPMTYAEALRRVVFNPTYFDFSITHDAQGTPIYSSNFYEIEGKEAGYTMEQCIRLSDRVIYVCSCELYGFKDCIQVDTWNTGEVYKYSSLNYADEDVRRIVVEECKKHENSNVNYITTKDKIPFDTYRIYFINGYFLDECYAIHVNITVKSTDGGDVVLSDMFFSRESDIEYNYLTTPKFISNKIYDKYIEVRIPAVKYICSDEAKELGESSSESDEFVTLAETLDVDKLTPVNISFSVVTSDDIVEYTGEENEEFDVMDSMKKNNN